MRMLFTGSVTMFASFDQPQHHGQSERGSQGTASLCTGYSFSLESTECNSREKKGEMGAQLCVQSFPKVLDSSPRCHGLEKKGSNNSQTGCRATSAGIKTYEVMFASYIRVKCMSPRKLFRSEQEV